ncbi:tetratricopeptide repeat protein [Polaromonas sp. YR568]|uniref:tetratricopeptide repeat protein n=1 Tax=Polaromonas sp. YR568 TaxID=1855301 RepID=UPI00313832E8
MDSINEEVLQAARVHLRAHRVREAEALAERWLARQPGSGQACAIRGLVCLANGRTDIAKDLIETAVSLAPQSAFAYLALAQCYLAQGKSEEAEPSLRRALALNPAETEASCLLATLRAFKDDLSGAEELLRQALALTPRSALAHLSLAELLYLQDRLVEAERIASVGLALDSEFAPGWLLQAKILAAQSQWIEARACCERALLLDPESAQCLTELARVLVLAGSQGGAHCEALMEAEAAARHAVTLMPREIKAHLVLGAALRAQGRIDEALASQAEMVRIAPQDPMPVFEIGLTQHEAGNLDAALLAAERALSLSPDMLAAQCMRIDVLLRRGELGAAFAALDRMDALARPTQPRLAVPLAGGDVAKRDIVLVAQSMVHAVLYARYVPLLAQMGARVSIAVDPLAHGLLQTVSGVAALLPLDANVQDAIVEPIMRLPALFCTDTASVPWNGLYCSADKDDVAQLQALFSERPARRVGLDLGPIPEPALAAAVADVLRDAGATVVALGPLGTAAQAFEGMSIETGVAKDLAQLAILAQALDGIVTVESLTAHVAGAAGAPCHLLLALRHDAIWGATGERTPWYPSMRLYREQRADGWHSAMRALAATLAHSAAQEAV